MRMHLKGCSANNKCIICQHLKNSLQFVRFSLKLFELNNIYSFPVIVVVREYVLKNGGVSPA
jgi:hypothetical protein